MKGNQAWCAVHKFARPEVLAAQATHHGAFDYEELAQARLDPEQMLDFSVNSNAYGPPPAVRDALRAVPLDRYPDREALALRRVLAERLGVAMSQIVAGNGTAELIWLIAAAFVRPRDRALVIEPTFGEYGRAVALAGGQVARWRAHPEDGFAVKTEQVESQIDDLHAKLVFLCNPNNPTGQVIAPDVVSIWAERHPQTLFVVDEAYLNFTCGLASASGSVRDNILVLRSMTKDYALAGLRLGYAVGRQDVIEVLARVRPPWSVNALAQAAGVAALEDQAWLTSSIQKLVQSKEVLVKELGTLGLPPVPSATHFFLVWVGDGATFRRNLMSRHVLVRDCASFGLPEYVRIATRKPEENARLLAAIREEAS